MNNCDMNNCVINNTAKRIAVVRKPSARQNESVMQALIETTTGFQDGF